MLTLVEAARKTGLITLARAIKSGRLSVNRKEDGSYEIDQAELARLYPFAASRAPGAGGYLARPINDVDLDHTEQASVAERAS